MAVSPGGGIPRVGPGDPNRLKTKMKHEEAYLAFQALRRQTHSVHAFLKETIELLWTLKQRFLLSSDDV